MKKRIARGPRRNERCPTAESVEDGYRRMAEDEAREAEAREWVEGTLLTFHETLDEEGL